MHICINEHAYVYILTQYIHTQIFLGDYRYGYITKCSALFLNK